MDADGDDNEYQLLMKSLACQLQTADDECVYICVHDILLCKGLFMLIQRASQTEITSLYLCGRQTMLAKIPTT